MKKVTKSEGLQAATSKDFTPSSYHSDKNKKIENHTTPTESLEADAKLKTDWLEYKAQCEKKIETNARNIFQFREKIGKIDTSQRRKFETKIAQLEKINEDLRLKIQNFSTARNKELAAFIAGQEADLKEFKKEFSATMKELI